MDDQQSAAAASHADGDGLDGLDGDAGMAALDAEIAGLEARLRAARARRQEADGGKPDTTAGTTAEMTAQQQQHFLLLLSDSALPLGAFAFSSGLESFLAHDKAAAGSPSGAPSGAAPPRQRKSGADAFAAFLPLSVTSYAYTAVPFVLAAHDAAAAAVVAAAGGRRPSAAALDAFTAELARLDDTFDATLVCTVGRRASVAQGRALLSVWERAFAPALASDDGGGDGGGGDPLRPFSLLVKRSASRAAAGAAAGAAADGGLLLADASAHQPPLFGAVAALAGLGRRQAADVFVLGHVKALASAAVRASLLGPYQAQRLLASAEVRQLVAQAVAGAWAVPVDEAGQTTPVVDLWMGRHELLYSRIFNS